MEKSVSIKLFLTIFVLSIFPLSTSYFLLSDILSRALNLGFSSQLNIILEQSENNLRKLRKLQPNQKQNYRKQFESIQSIKSVYQDVNFLKSTLLKSFITYWAIGLALVLFTSLIVVIWLSRSISNQFKLKTKELLETQDRVKYLAGVSQWQTIARKLAHELKNPLTPIELSVSSLLKAFKKQPATAFEKQLTEVNNMIAQEVNSLKTMILSFSEFGKLPSANLQSTDILDFIQRFSETHKSSWQNVNIGIKTNLKQMRVNLDITLLRQVFTNLIQNAAEANKDSFIHINIHIEELDNKVLLRIVNTGIKIPKNNLQDIFELYYSTKIDKENMGMGLAIVKKIILEHNGNISCDEVETGVQFSISLPKELND